MRQVRAPSGYCSRKLLPLLRRPCIHTIDRVISSLILSLLTNDLGRYFFPPRSCMGFPSYRMPIGEFRHAGKVSPQEVLINISPKPQEQKN